LFNTEKVPHIEVTTPNIKYVRVKKSEEIKIDCKKIFQAFENFVKATFGKT
jgi:hypothetical protein